MQTEFTCGIFTAISIGTQWTLSVNNRPIGYIDNAGELINWVKQPPLTTSDMLIEIAVLMNNIKRQYKQLQSA